ncbi:hypothetical protein TSUD_81510 [Trifolium subterraneum]|uniref:Uncharacterized protein n=1 Tax=Trifolium subterraneum TaxID=3900 RepID=A0A2Z6MWP4_TRISU|nr:hypothetical protein TSUD_81510 [Trifolium subterraneum]
MFPDRWIFASFGFCDGRIWTVGLLLIMTLGLMQRLRSGWRPNSLSSDSTQVYAFPSDSTFYLRTSEMKSTAASLRKLQADKKRRQAGGATSSTPNISGQSSPTPSIEVTGERRVAEELVGELRPPKQARVEGGGGVVSGPRRLVPGKAATEFVLPPAMGHDCLLDGKTTVKVSEADQTILASMGPESLRNVVAESSVAVFKLLEVATFLNGRECKYMRERDEARAHAKDFGKLLTVVEQDLLARGKALEDSEAEVAKVKKELEDAKGEEEKLKGKIAGLEEQVSRLSLVEEEEKKLDPEGTYAKFSRADLIAKIYQIGDMQLDVASSSFQNALAQLQVLNPGVQLVTEGLDELKEVRDGRIATPPPDEDHGCLLMSRIVSTVPEQFVELHECLASSQTRVEESFLHLKSFLAAVNIPSRAGRSVGLVLSNGASPQWDLQPSLKSMSNYAIFNYSIVLAFQRSTCEGFLCRRDLRAIFCLRVASRREALVLSSSTRSSSYLSNSSFISSSGGYSILEDGSPISTGITASVPYVNRKGVSPVVEWGVVL